MHVVFLSTFFSNFNKDAIISKLLKHYYILCSFQTIRKATIFLNQHRRPHSTCIFLYMYSVKSTSQLRLSQTHIHTTTLRQCGYRRAIDVTLHASLQLCARISTIQTALQLRKLLRRRARNATTTSSSAMYVYTVLSRKGRRAAVAETKQTSTIDKSSTCWTYCCLVV